MTHTFSKSAFYSFGDIPLGGPLPLIFSQLLRHYKKPKKKLDTIFILMLNKFPVRKLLRSNL
jgi:hypothetical protein